MGCQVHSLCFNIEWIFHRAKERDEGRMNVNLRNTPTLSFPFTQWIILYLFLNDKTHEKKFRFFY